MSRPDLDILRAQRRQIELFSRKGAIAELRHLTAGPYIPANAEGRIDHGFNCRTNAFIAAGSLAAVGCITSIVHGKAMFVLGPSGRLSPILLEVDPHAWVGIDGHGFYDVSPNFQHAVEPRLKAADHIITILGELKPSGRTVMARDEFDYAYRVDVAKSNDSEPSAIYLGREFDEVRSQLLRENLLDIYNSPLTDRLREKYDAAILVKAIRHMVDFARGRALTLTAYTQDEAWRKIDRLPSSSVDWLLGRLNRR